MGTKLTITEKDINRAKLLPPGWYPVEVTGYEESPASEKSKNPGSTNMQMEMVVEGPAEYQGAVLQRTFNETVPGFAIEYIKACGGNITPGQSYDLESTVGKKIMAHVLRGEYQGRGTNNVDGFRAKS